MDEYSWVGAKVWLAYEMLQREKAIADTQKEIGQQNKKNEQKLADLKVKLRKMKKRKPMASVS